MKSLDLQVFREFYKKHKNYLIPVVTIIISFILLVKLTIPQINMLSTREQEVKIEKAKLETLKNNLNVISSVKDEKVSSELSLATDALPQVKNFAAILSSVSIAANKAGIFLGDYEFQVGDLSKTPTQTKTLPSLQLSLSVNGGAASTIKFIEELYKSLPLSEVSTVEVTSSRSIVNVFFYYKPFPTTNINNSSFSNFSKNDNDLLSKLSTFNNPKVLEQTSTNSANFSSPFQ